MAFQTSGRCVGSSGCQAKRSTTPTCIALAAKSKLPVVKLQQSHEPRHACLAAVSFRPVPKQDDVSAAQSIGLGTESFRPVPKRCPPSEAGRKSLGTESVRSVPKPLRTDPPVRCRVWRPNRMKKRRFSCFSDPRWEGFPSDKGLHRRGFPSQRRYALLLLAGDMLPRLRPLRQRARLTAPGRQTSPAQAGPRVRLATVPNRPVVKPRQSRKERS